MPYLTTYLPLPMLYEILYGKMEYGMMVIHVLWQSDQVCKFEEQ